MSKPKTAQHRGYNHRAWYTLREDRRFCGFLYYCAKENSGGDLSSTEAIIGKEIIVDGDRREVSKAAFKRIFENGAGAVKYSYVRAIMNSLCVDIDKLINEIVDCYIQRNGPIGAGMQFIEDRLLYCAAQKTADANSAAYRLVLPSTKLEFNLSKSIKDAKIAESAIVLEAIAEILTKIRNGESVDNISSELWRDTSFTPSQFAEDIILSLNPLANPEMRGEFFKLTGPYFAEANRLVGWGPFLPCSLETPQFMEKHHENIFANRLGRSAGSDRIRALVREYNLIGHESRERTKGQLSHNKDYQFVHIIDRVALNEIIDFSGDYSSFNLDDLLSQAEYLDGLGKEYGDRIQVFVSETTPLFPLEFHDQIESIDSYFVILTDEKPLIAVARTQFGTMHIIRDGENLSKILASLEGVCGGSSAGIGEISDMLKLKK